MTDDLESQHAEEGDRVKPDQITLTPFAQPLQRGQSVELAINPDMQAVVESASLGRHIDATSGSSLLVIEASAGKHLGVALDHPVAAIYVDLKHGSATHVEIEFAPGGSMERVVVFDGVATVHPSSGERLPGVMTDEMRRELISLLAGKEGALLDAARAEYSADEAIDDLLARNAASILESRYEQLGHAVAKPLMPVVSAQDERPADFFYRVKAGYESFFRALDVEVLIRRVETRVAWNNLTSSDLARLQSDLMDILNRVLDLPPSTAPKQLG